MRILNLVVMIAITSAVVYGQNWSKNRIDHNPTSNFKQFKNNEPKTVKFKKTQSNKYYIRVLKTDDAGRAYLDDTLIIDVGFDEDSNWLDITADLKKGDNTIKFEVINKTGAIAYLFQIKKNNKIVFEQSCGTVGVIGCENNRAFRVGVAREFSYVINWNK